MVASEAHYSKERHSNFMLGFNYIPSSSGCRFWLRWNPEEIRQDLFAMAASGVDVVRFFVFWADFEPQPGSYDPTLLSRLEEFVALAFRAGIACVPSILTVWMNGQLFDLSWRRGRDLWQEPEMRSRSIAFVRVIARHLSRFPNILAYDIGDEIFEAPIGEPSLVDTPSAERWYSDLVEAIHSEHPDVPVCQANQGSFLWSGDGFSPSSAVKLDGLMVHGYPAWTPFSVESANSYKARIYPAFLAQLATAFSDHVILDEFGSYGVSESLLATFVTTAGASCLSTQVKGLICWCWRDLASTDKPYDSRPNERLVGFTRLDGAPKPSLTALQKLRELRDQASNLQIAPPDVGIMTPDFGEENGHSYLAPPKPDATALFISYNLAKRAHLQVAFTSEPTNAYRLLIVPCCKRLTVALLKKLRQYVHEGGCLLYSPGSYMESAGDQELFGIELIDFTLQHQALGGFTFDGTRLPLFESLPGDNRRQLPIVRAAGALPLAYFEDGSPALLSQRYGDGVAAYLNCPFEELLDFPGSLSNADWHSVYDKIAAMAEVKSPFGDVSPDVELVRFVAQTTPSASRWLGINHGSSDASIPAEDGVIQNLTAYTAQFLT